MTDQRSVAIVGAGIFGLSLALALRKRHYNITVFDQHRYDETGYAPGDAAVQAASVDHNKIFRASYGTKLHYQKLALESRKGWLEINQAAQQELFVPSGMLRVQPSGQLGALERETLANMERDGLRDTQFIKSDPVDRQRATDLGWASKLLEFGIPGASGETFEAVLDSIAGFTRCSEACNYYRKLCAEHGVSFRFGSKEGTFDCLVETVESTGQKRAVGLRTKDGIFHAADVVVIAAGSFSTQLFPGLSYHLESSAGSVVTFKIDRDDSGLWEKYSPERFPVITWKSAPRSHDGKDTGSVYVLPRTPDGILKIGYRGIKFTNFEDAPAAARFSQEGQWSVPLPPEESSIVPEEAIDPIRTFVAIFLPEFKDTPFCTTKLCWYTDTLDNSFVIDYAPTFAGRSLFVCTGGSGHGAKFLPVLGEHAASIFEDGDEASSPMRPFWRWREDVPRRNGLEEGPYGPRNLSRTNRDA